MVASAFRTGPANHCGRGKSVGNADNENSTKIRIGMLPHAFLKDSVLLQITDFKCHKDEALKSLAALLFCVGTIWNSVCCTMYSDETSSTTPGFWYSHGLSLCNSKCYS